MRQLLALALLPLFALLPATAANWDPDLTGLGIVLEPAEAAPGQRYWRLTDAWADSPAEGGGNVDIYYWVRLANGNPADVWVTRITPQGAGTILTGPDGYDHLRMDGGNWCPATPPGPYSVGVRGPDYANPDPSDWVVGMGLPCNLHWSYRLMFQETVMPGEPTATPTPAPDADGDGLPDPLEGDPPAPGQGHRWLPDSDGDGLLDGHEDADADGAQGPGETAVRDADSDDDRYEDGIEERLLGTDPLDAAHPTGIVDADGDQLPGFFDLNDASPDQDGDAFRDGYEAVVLDLGAASNAGRRPPLGDANGDAAVSNLDALIVQSLFLRTADPGAVQAANADLTRDGHISNLDALAAQSFFLSGVPVLPL